MKRMHVIALAVVVCLLSCFENSAQAGVIQNNISNASNAASVVTQVPQIDVLSPSGETSSFVTSISTGSFSTNQPNELLLAFIATDSAPSGGMNVTSVSGAGLTWELVQRANRQPGDAEIWRAFAPSQLTGVSVTAKLAQNTAASITVVSFSGVDTSGSNGSGAIGANANFSAASGAPSGSIVTTRNNSLVFAVGADWDAADARTPGANQSIVHQYLTSVNSTYWVQMLNAPVPTSGSSVSLNDTAPTDDKFDFAMVEVLPANSAGTPDFTLTADPSSQSVSAGLSTSYAVTINGQNGYTGNTALIVSGLPSGATAAFNPQILSGSGASTLLISTTPAVAPGSYPLTISATGSGVTHTATITLSVVAPADFSLTVVPPSQPVQAGSSTTFALTLTGKNGYSGTPSLSVNGLPTGATASFNPASITGSGNSTLTIATQTSTPAGKYSLVVAASDGPLNHSVTVSLTVTASATSPLAIDAVSPSGESSSFVTTISTGAFSTNQSNELLLAFIATDSSPSGGMSVTSVSGGGLTWQLVQRASTQPGDAEIWRAFASSPLSNVTVTANLAQNTAAAISVVSFVGVDTSGANGSGAIGANANFSAPSGAPTGSLVTTRNNSLVLGVGADWDAADARTPGTNQSILHQYLTSVNSTYWLQMLKDPIAAGGTSVTLNDTAPNGDKYNLAVVEVLPASSAGTPDFGLSASPSSQSVAPGSNVNYAITINPQNGYTGNTTLSISGLPAGATSAFNPQIVSGSGSSTLTISTTASIVSGTYPLSVVATGSGGITHTASVALVVDDPATFTVSASPASQSIQAGSSTQFTVSVSPQNGFSGTVNLSIAGLPSGVTGSFNPSSLPGSGSSTLTITSSSSAPAGSYPLTVNASSGGTTRTAGVTLAITSTSTPHSVSLTWTDGDSGIAGYNVYRSTQAGTNYTKVNSGLVSNTGYSDSAVASGTTYYYVVTAVNSSGAESAYSTEARAVIPTP